MIIFLRNSALML